MKELKKRFMIYDDNLEEAPLITVCESRNQWLMFISERPNTYTKFGVSYVKDGWEIWPVFVGRKDVRYSWVEDKTEKWRTLTRNK